VDLVGYVFSVFFAYNTEFTVILEEIRRHHLADELLSGLSECRDSVFTERLHLEPVVGI
jgi:hypothetical protein